MRIARTLICLCLLLSAVMPATGASARKRDLRDDFFTNGFIPRVCIELDQSALASLRQDSHRYVHATVKEAGAIFRDVALHLKGAEGSFQPLEKKPCLTLNFDKFVRDQRFHGLDKLYLNNAMQDPLTCTNSWAVSCFVPPVSPPPASPTPASS